MQRSERYMGTVDVTNRCGDGFVSQLKEHFPGKLRYRARRQNRKELEDYGIKLNHCKDVPIAYAERIAVYLKG